jgi:hypothetical protein
MRLAIGTPDLMQRLPGFPTALDVFSLGESPDCRPWVINTILKQKRLTSIRWCWIDLSNAPRVLVVGMNHHDDVGTGNQGLAVTSLLIFVLSIVLIVNKNR